MESIGDGVTSASSSWPFSRHLVGQPNTSVFGSKLPRPEDWMAYVLPSRYEFAISTLPNPVTFASAIRSSSSICTPSKHWRFKKQSKRAELNISVSKQHHPGLNWGLSTTIDDCLQPGLHVTGFLG